MEVTYLLVLMRMGWLAVHTWLGGGATTSEHSWRVLQFRGGAERTGRWIRGVKGGEELRGVGSIIGIGVESTK